MSPIKTRPYEERDIPGMRRILNEIVALGGTTAIQRVFTDAAFAASFLSAEALLRCFVALDEEAAVAGFQMLHRHQKLPPDWADIATFARLEPKLPGVGAALFERTKTFAEEAGLSAINATIRADNAGGLAYYDKMGFETYATASAVPLDDGTPVDRISKRFRCA